MTNDKLLADTFAEHENLAPDADLTLAAILSRTEAPPHTGRRVAIGATVAVVAAAAVAAGVLGRDDGGTTHRPAAPGTAVSSSVPTPAPTPVKVQITPVSIGIKPGWLPSGLTVSDWFSMDGMQYIAYELPGTEAGVYLSHEAADPNPPFKAGPDEHGTPTTIAGRPAREHASGQSYEVWIQLADGTLGHVLVYNLPGGAAALATTGRQVADTADFSASTEFTPAFGAGSGTPIHSVDGGGSGDTAWVTYTFGGTTPITAGVDVPGALGVPVAIDASGSSTTSYTAGRPVQGHQTQVGSDGSLRILDAVNGHPVVLSGAALDTLYQLADALILP